MSSEVGAFISDSGLGVEASTLGSPVNLPFQFSTIVIEPRSPVMDSAEVEDRILEWESRLPQVQARREVDPNASCWQQLHARLLEWFFSTVWNSRPPPQLEPGLSVTVDDGCQGDGMVGCQPSCGPAPATIVEPMLAPNNPWLSPPESVVYGTYPLQHRDY